MTPRATIHFFRETRTGAFILFILLVGGGLFLLKGFVPNSGTARAATEPVQTPQKEKPQIVETITRNMVAFNPPNDAQPTPSASPAETKESKPSTLAPISLYADSSPAEPVAEKLGNEYAPFGRLIQCELVITVDSSAIDTPIVGLVTDDVWHNGRLIIPAGTEVHGKARVDRVRERIASTGEWTLVWQTGEELTLNGLALDREKDQQDEGWGISDGSAGLRGQLIKSDDLAEVKLFAATFLSGAASALSEKQQTLLGTQIMPTLKNAPYAGAQEVLSAYAQQILDTIQRDGFYVRAAAGKQFYLYVTQTIDKSKAVIGGTRYADLHQSDKDHPKPPDSLVEIRKQMQRRYAPAAAISLPAKQQPTPSPQDTALFQGLPELPQK